VQFRRQRNALCVRQRLKTISATAILGLQQVSILESCICLSHRIFLSASWLTFGIEPAEKMQRSLLTAIGQGRCPRCREGLIFKYPLTQFRNFSAMNAFCSSCEASFEPEPGFYFGAMYVSYGFTILLFIFMWIVLRVFSTLRIWFILWPL
jgi:uncharacterized protein (DUF983 family)